jgi:hypothetical protein
VLCSELEADCSSDSESSGATPTFIMRSELVVRPLSLSVAVTTNTSYSSANVSSSRVISKREFEIENRLGSQVLPDI